MTLEQECEQIVCNPENVTVEQLQDIKEKADKQGFYLSFLFGRNLTGDYYIQGYNLSKKTILDLTKRTIPIEPKIREFMKENEISFMDFKELLEEIYDEELDN